MSISVPIGSRVWHLLQQWRMDPNENVSLNVCDALSEKSELVKQNQALRKQREVIGQLLKERNECGCRAMSLTDWQWYFGKS